MSMFRFKDKNGVLYNVMEISNEDFDWLSEESEDFYEKIQEIECTYGVLDIYGIMDKVTSEWDYWYDSYEIEIKDIPIVIEKIKNVFIDCLKAKPTGIVT